MPEPLQAHLREEAIRLLSAGLADTVLGFAQSGPGGAAVPFFARTPEQAALLHFSRQCTPHLAVYLPRLAGKTALFAKPCDARAAVVMLAENRVQRENLTLLCFCCPGMTDAKGTLLAACAACEDPTPPLYDVLLQGSPFPAKPPPPANAPPNHPERFAQELEKCTLCYACRAACPGCGCPACFAERGPDGFLAATPGPGDKWLFHLGRAMHLAGRCVGCGGCEEACAFGVDLAFLRRAAARFIWEEYGFTAGMDPRVPGALQDHSLRDEDKGFYGGDGNE